ncbi:MAG: rRNA adenine N(6)-methyltransferase family protein [Acidimicrobiales bacterium]
MSGRERRSDRDQRRRSLGQNFLVDQSLISKLICDLQIVEDELVVDLGAGSGALTVPLAQAGARVWAVERDPAWADRLASDALAARLDDRIRVIRSDLRRLRFPREPFRVVANPPFNLTTDVLKLLLDDPSSRSATRVDLVLQREVVMKHASQPPKALTTACWSPWWEFSAGRRIPAAAFRPRPSIDAAVLTIRRRDPPVLPIWLAPRFEDLLRSSWQPPHPQ